MRAKKAELRVRRTTLRDIRALVHHRRGMWEDMGLKDRIALDRADLVYEKWLRREMRSGGAIGWVAEVRRHAVVGGACLWLRPRPPMPMFSDTSEPYLFSMFTEPEYRRKGVASQILIEAAKWSRKHGYRRITLHASKKGSRVYARRGFERTWEMRRDLSKTGLTRIGR